MDDPYNLTDKEVEVLKLASEGLSNQEIAKLLYVRYSTVAQHFHCAFRKLSVNNRTAAVRVAIRRGDIPPIGEA